MFGSATGASVGKATPSLSNGVPAQAADPDCDAVAQAEDQFRAAIAADPAFASHPPEAARAFAQFVLKYATPREGATPGPGCLDLRALPGKLPSVLLTLAAPAWRALDGWMAARHGCPIRDLLLPPPASSAQLKGLSGSLGPLTGLQTLGLTAPADGRQLNLSDCSSWPAPPRLVIFLKTPAAAFDVLVPDPMAVEFESHLDGLIEPRRLQVHRVSSTNGDSTQAGVSPPAKAPAPQPLQAEKPAGLAYYSTPRQADGKPISPSDPQYATFTSLDLNCTVELDASQMQADDQDESLIVCRDLALQWIEDRREWAHRKDGDANDFYRHYKAADGLRGLVSSRTKTEVLERLTQPPDHQTPLDRLGDFLASEFSSMGPSGRCHFFLGGQDHAMALELRTKLRADGTTACVINFYDPNLTSTHVRTVLASPDRMRGTRLDHWLKQSGLASYPMQDGKLHIWAYQPLPRTGAGADGASKASAPTAGTPPDTADDPLQRTLETAMASGDAQGTAVAVQAVLAAATPKDRAACLRRLRASDALGRPALYVAMRYGSAAVVESFVKAVLEAPAGVLDARDRFSLLQALRQGATGPERPALSAQAAKHDLQGVLAYVQAILAAPADVLSSQQKMALLGSPHPSLRGLSPLQNLVLVRSHGNDDYRAPAVQALAGAILKAPGLGLEQKQQLLQRPSPSRGDTGIAGSELHPNDSRTATAGLVLAILHSELAWPQRMAMIRGVCEDLPGCLYPQGPGAQPLEPEWAARLLVELRKAPEAVRDEWMQGLLAATAVAAG